MQDLLTIAGMGYAMTLIILVAAFGAVLGVLSGPASAARTKATRGVLRRRLAGTLMPGMLARLGFTLDEFCEDHTPAQLRQALDGCRNCSMHEMCRAEQQRPPGEATAFSFCPNRRVF